MFTLLTPKQNFFKALLLVDCGNGSVASEKIYVSVAPTNATGWLVLSSSNASKHEILYYSSIGSDTTGAYVVVASSANRGLGGTTAQVHSKGETVRQNITSLDFEEVDGKLSLLSPLASPTFTGHVTVPTPTSGSDAVTKDYVDASVVAGASDASTTVRGVTRLSTNPGTNLGNPTITIASPAVVTLASHGLTANDEVVFTTTGALPTGITFSNTYYVIATGLTTNTFRFSATQGGSAVNTTGSQSGTHSLTLVTPVAVGALDPRLPLQTENDAMVGTSGTPSSSNKFVTNADTTGSGPVLRYSTLKFGGSGADGALAITSGTTTIDLAGAVVFTKNYSSISITGTATLAFINPATGGTLVRLLSAGDVTLTSSSAPMIDCSGLGAAADTTAGSLFILDSVSHAGGAAGGISGGPAGTAVTANPLYTRDANALYRHDMYLVVGSGGSTGPTGVGSGGNQAGGIGGNGGRGGGALYMECAGNFNFTTANGISVSGQPGGVGQDAPTSNRVGGAGGGGGSTGSALILYNGLTSNSGTITCKGGDGGSAGQPNGSPGSLTAGGGGGGAGGFGAGGAGSARVDSGNGTNGSNGTLGGGGGGAGVNAGGTHGNGGTGATDPSAVIVTKNIWFT